MPFNVPNGQNYYLCPGLPFPSGASGGGVYWQGTSPINWHLTSDRLFSVGALSTVQFLERLEAVCVSGGSTSGRFVICNAAAVGGQALLVPPATQGYAGYLFTQTPTVGDRISMVFPHPIKNQQLLGFDMIAAEGRDLGTWFVTFNGFYYTQV